MGVHDERLDKRMALESALGEYYKVCQLANYDFKDDLKDVVWDATNGEVDISVD
jgi:hypothetical protein